MSLALMGAGKSSPGGGAPPPAGYSATVLADTPLLYWRLGESSGTTAVDASGNGRDGLYVNSPTLGTAGALAGDANTAITCDGSNDRVTIAYNPFVSGSSRTFEAWLAVTAAAGAVFGDWPGDDDPVFKISSVDQNVQLKVGGTTVTWLAVWPANTAYHHMVLTYNDTSKVAELFIDGVSQGTQTLGASYGTSGNLIVGDNWSVAGNAPFNGKMDEFAIYGTILSGARISAHYAAGI